MSYCKLYIDTELPETQLRALFAKGFEECASEQGIEYTLFNNDYFSQHTNVTSATYPIERSRYYVEIDSELYSDSSAHEFNEAISRLIILLRRRCDYVVASCDFEEYIIEVTGWNWTKETPLPPDR